MTTPKKHGSRVSNEFGEKVSFQNHNLKHSLPDTIGLGGPDGPLEKFKGVMLKLQSKLNPVRGMKGVGKRLVWSFDKGKGFGISVYNPENNTLHR